MKKLLLAFISGFFTGGLLFLFVPFLLVRVNNHFFLLQKSSFASLLAGLFLLLSSSLFWWYCAYHLSTKGRGTPAPIASTTKLVIKGPYKWSRNPMYLCYQAIFLGIALVFGHLLLFAYAFIMTLFIHYYVYYVEEPVMRKKFKAEYDHYCQHVRRWLGTKTSN